jgi:DNA-directed RNA polymerase subunit E'/Rpb7
MEQFALFEEKVYLAPKAMHLITKVSLDSILLEQLKSKLENKCSQNGFVIPNSLELISRSMGQLENGRYTGNIVFHVQAKGRVYNPANGTRVKGTILKQNKMGLYIIYDNAIRILVPRDLHIGNEEFDNLRVGDIIEVEIRKSRFQIQDKFILSVGVFIERTSADDMVTAQKIPETDDSNSEESNSDDEESKAEDQESNKDLSDGEGLLGDVEFNE